VCPRFPSDELRERLGIDDIILVLQQNRLQRYGMGMCCERKITHTHTHHRHTHTHIHTHTHNTHIHNRLTAFGPEQPG